MVSCINISGFNWDFLNLRFVSAAYAIVIRSSEYDLSTEMLDDIVAQSISMFIRKGDSGHDVPHRRPIEIDTSDEGK